MKKTLLILFLFSFSILYSQNIDSLKNIIKTGNTTEVINSCIAVSEAYFYSNPDSAEYYLISALKEVQRIDDKKRHAKILMKIGVLSNDKGNIENAKEHFLQALDIAENINDTSLILSAKGNLGNSYLNLSQYKEAAKYYFEVIEIAEKTKNLRIQALVNGALGNLYLIKNDYDKSLIYYKKSQSIFKEMNNTTGIALSLMNIATVYSNTEKYKIAVSKYNEADKIFKKTGDALNSAKCLSGIAKIYSKIEKYNKSIKTAKKALKKYKAFGTKTDITYSYNMIAANYMKIKQFKTAILFLDSAFNLSEKDNNYLKLERITDNLSICYNKLENYKKAYYYLKLHQTFYDSIFNIENEKKFSELEIKFETTKKEQLIQLHKKNEELFQKESKNRLILLISVSSFMFLLLITLFLFYNRKKLKSEIKQSELENKLHRVQMNPHFIFNVLSSIEHFMYKNDLQSSSIYIAEFAKLMRLILESSRKELISLKEEIEILNYYVKFQKLRINYPLEFNINVTENIDTENCLIPPMLVQPFIENSFKHAFNEKTKHAVINISFRLINNFIFAEIEDNGFGISDLKNEKHKSLAIQITKERLAKITKRKDRKEILKIQDLKFINPKLHGTKISFKIPYIEEF